GRKDSRREKTAKKTSEKTSAFQKPAIIFVQSRALPRLPYRAPRAKSIDNKARIHQRERSVCLGAACKDRSADRQAHRARRNRSVLATKARFHMPARNHSARGRPS